MCGDICPAILHEIAFLCARSPGLFSLFNTKLVLLGSLPFNMKLANSSANLSLDVTRSVAVQDICPPYQNYQFDTLPASFPYILNAVINVVLGLLASSTNCVVLAALYRSCSICLPSKLFLGGLVLSDLTVGLFVQPQFVGFLVTKADDRTALSCFFARLYGFLASMLGCVSLFTIAGISFERYIALFMHVRYRRIVTARRVAAALSFTWSFAAFYASLWLWKRLLWGFFTYVGMLGCIAAISLAQIRIYVRLRRQVCRRMREESRQFGAHQRQTRRPPPNSLKFRRMASSVLWIYSLFLLCYSPYLATFLWLRYVKPSLLFQYIHELCMTLMHLNSCLNPFVYCVRLPEIRGEVLKILRKCRLQRKQVSPHVVALRQ